MISDMIRDDPLITLQRVAVTDGSKINLIVYQPVIYTRSLRC